MDVIQEILKWSETDLPLWARDALRRKFKNSQLSNEDYDELYQLVLKDNSIPTSSTVIAKPLSRADIPSGTNVGNIVKLKELKDLSNVNRIAPAQTLKFCPDGMTIIYGGNGAGKSGYGRVLKHACRAREKSGKILSNVHDSSLVNKIPTANFVIENAGETCTLPWSYAETPPCELSSISVFDTLCATSYLKEGEAAYLPRGLDILEDLADKLIPSISSKVEVAANSIDVNMDVKLLFNRESQVGVLLNSLSHKTNSQVLVKLSNLTDKESIRFRDLERILSEKNPLDKFKEIKRNATHLKELSSRIDKCSRYVNSQAMERLKYLIEAVENAEKNLAESACKLAAGENLLKNTGSDIWKDLFLSARKFSLDCAYPEHSFPHVSDDARCVLCQQPISNAAERITRFNEFINHDLSKVVDDKKEELKNARNKIIAANLDFSFGEILRDEVGRDNHELISHIERYQVEVKEIKNKMLQMIDDKLFTEVVVSSSPIVLVRKNAAEKLREAREYLKASRSSNVDSLTKELIELKDRVILSEKIDAIDKLIERIKLCQKLKSINFSALSRKVSSHSKRLAGTVITTSLKKSLDEEFNFLGISNIRTILKERVSKGKVYYSLLLDIPTSNNIDIVLSEGEQRAASIASFLAELKLSSHGCGIIFDDPVSSLDHHRRRKVATRLVDESKNRQVIILTHDISFLSELTSAIEKDGVPHEIHHLEWMGGHSGFIHAGLPWDKAKYKERIDILKRDSKKLDPWPNYPSQENNTEMRHLYGRMRSTIEKIVEDIYCAGIVIRFEDMVGVGNLHRISGINRASCDEMSELWKKCHRIIEAHDQSANKQTQLPTPNS